MMKSISRRRALTGTAAVGFAAPALSALAGCGGSDDALVPLDATTAEIPVKSGKIFADSGVVVTQPTTGDFRGFSSICTHQGCVFSDVTTTINCKCHGSQFSIKDGTNIKGPGEQPAGSVDDLEEIELTLDGDTITTA